MNHRFLLIIIIILNFSALAADWSETSVSFLRGNDSAEFFSKDRPVSEVTIQHASGWSYGDNFIWLDLFDYFKSSNDNIESSLYGEWSPRFSLGKIFGFHNNDGFIRDILQSNTIEFGRSQSGETRGKLYGLAIDFNIEGFDFFQYNFYLRDNPDLEGSTWQSTFAYRYTYTTNERIQFFWAAYIDIVHGNEGSGSNTVKSHWHSAQQLLFDMGALFRFQKKTLYAGLEFQYWSKKFGIDQFGDEKNLKFMISWFL